MFYRLRLFVCSESELTSETMSPF